MITSVGVLGVLGVPYKRWFDESIWVPHELSVPYNIIETTAI